MGSEISTLVLEPPKTPWWVFVLSPVVALLTLGIGLALGSDSTLGPTFHPLMALAHGLAAAALGLALFHRKTSKNLQRLMNIPTALPSDRSQLNHLHDVGAGQPTRAIDRIEGKAEQAAKGWVHFLQVAAGAVVLLGMSTAVVQVLPRGRPYPWTSAGLTPWAVTIVEGIAISLLTIAARTAWLDAIRAWSNRYDRLVGKETIADFEAQLTDKDEEISILKAERSKAETMHRLPEPSPTPLKPAPILLNAEESVISPVKATPTKAPPAKPLKPVSIAPDESLVSVAGQTPIKVEESLPPPPPIKRSASSILPPEDD